MRYDIVMLSCEGLPTAGVTATTATYLAPYVNAGGRVFAEHYHYAFFTAYNKTPGTPYPQFANVADWTTVGLAANDGYSSDISGVIETTLPNGQAFPEGVALKAWLGNVGALNANGEIVVPVATARVNGVVSASNVATPWVQTDPSVSPPSTQYFSWDMPFNPPVDDAGVPQYCGRVVYSDMHVSGTAADYKGGTVVPSGCDATTKLSADEDAIEFILFDLSSCITPVGFTPQPPPQPEGGPAQRSLRRARPSGPGEPALLEQRLDARIAAAEGAVHRRHLLRVPPRERIMSRKRWPFSRVMPPCSTNQR